MDVFNLTPGHQEGIEARQRALAYLRDPRYYRTAISLHGRLSFAKFSESSYLITNEQREARYCTVIAVLDRARRPETELWMFGDWEATAEGDYDQAAAQASLRDLLKTIKSLPVPDSVHAPAASETASPDNAEVDHNRRRRDVYTAQSTNGNIILCGAVHERTLPLLRAIDALSPDFSHSEVPYLTYTFDKSHLSNAQPLPPGLRWDSLQSQHFDLVRARTVIPRQASTLAMLPSVGIVSDYALDPIAWGFIGLDGSLTTLHVEPDFRRRGLAKSLTHMLLTEKMAGFFVDGAPEVGHGHVAHTNEASRRLCESVGGHAIWSVHWVVIDLSRLKDN